MDISNGCRTCDLPVCEIADAAYLYKQYEKDSSMNDFFSDRAMPLENHIDHLCQCICCMVTPASIAEYGDDKDKVIEIADKLDRMVRQIEEFNSDAKTRRVLSSAYKLIGENVSTILGEGWESRSRLAQDFNDANKVFTPFGEEVKDYIGKRNVGELINEINGRLHTFVSDHGLQVYEDMAMEMSEKTPVITVGDLITGVTRLIEYITSRLAYDDMSSHQKLDYNMPLLDAALQVLYIVSPPTSSYRSIISVLKDRFITYFDQYKEEELVNSVMAALITFRKFMVQIEEGKSENVISMEIPVKGVSEIIHSLAIYVDPSFWMSLYQLEGCFTDILDRLEVANGAVTRFRTAKRKSDRLFEAYHVFSEISAVGDVVREYIRKNDNPFYEKLITSLPTLDIACTRCQVLYTFFGPAGNTNPTVMRSDYNSLSVGEQDLVDRMTDGVTELYEKLIGEIAGAIDDSVFS